MITELVSRDELAAHLIDLFEQYQVEIFGYLYRMVSDSALAQDLTQETFLKAFNARQCLPEIKNPRAWLYRIATNLALNAIKRWQRFVWLPWRATDGQSNDINASEQVDRRMAIEAALLTLQPEYRAPLLLYTHYGFSVSEVAEALGLSVGAVRTRLYRAREMFRRAYREESGA